MTDPRFVDRLTQLVLADTPPAGLVHRTQAAMAGHRSGASAQQFLLEEASEALEAGGFDRAAARLRELQPVFALGPRVYGRVIPAVLAGAPSLPPAGAR